MGFANIASTGSGAPTTTDPHTFSHGAGASVTPGFVLVYVAVLSASDAVNSVTYDGVSLTEVSGSPRLVTAGAEDGSVYAYFSRAGGWGSGTRTVSIDKTSAINSWAVCITATSDVGAGFFISGVQNMDSAGVANPSVTLTDTLSDALLTAMLWSGANAVGSVTAPANHTLLTAGGDLGNQVSNVIRRDSLVSGTSTTIQFTAASEEAGIIAVAVQELILAPTGPTVTVSTGTPALALSVTPSAPTVSITPGTATVSQAGGDQSVTPSAPTVSIAPGTPALALSVAPTGPTVSITPGTPSLGLRVTPSAPTVSITPGTPSVALSVAPTAPTVTVTPGTPTLTPGAVSITPTAPTVNITTGTPSLRLNVTPNAPTVSITPGTPALSLAITPTAPTVTITPGDASVLTAGSQLIEPEAPTVVITPGTVTVSREEVAVEGEQRPGGTLGRRGPYYPAVESAIHEDDEELLLLI